MIKKVIQINITLLMLVFIVSIPLIYADWSKLTIEEDTNVIKYDEIKFIRDNYPMYYIYYDENKPYIGTNYNVYNINNDWNYTNIYNYNCTYDINEDLKYILIDFIDYGYIQIIIDVLPSTQYYLYFNTNVNNSNDNSIIIEIIDNIGTTSKIIDKNIDVENEFYINTNLTTRKISIKIYNHKKPLNISLNRLWFNEGNSKKPDYIDRQAETYINEHTDYKLIGSIIIDSFKSFVDKIMNPIEFLLELFESFIDFIWDIIKDLLPFIIKSYK